MPLSDRNHDKLFSLIYKLIDIPIALAKKAHWMLIAWWGFDSIKYGLSELAGKETIADINVVYQYIFEVFEVNTIPWLVAAVALINGFIGYLLYFKERSSKADIIEQMEGIRVEYEKLIDPDRSSSELTKRGETPK